jgi:hypothetical protein
MLRCGTGWSLTSISAPGHWPVARLTAYPLSIRNSQRPRRSAYPGNSFPHRQIKCQPAGTTKIYGLTPLPGYYDFCPVRSNTPAPIPHPPARLTQYAACSVQHEVPDRESISSQNSEVPRLAQESSATCLQQRAASSCPNLSITRCKPQATH